MDFRESPRAGGEMSAFSLDDLEPEAADYLRAAGADQATPIERLAHMNPLAIDLYTEHSIDLWTEPLEIAVCAQHQNGGLAVDRWWQSTIPHTFVIGEMAGTHGVKRPGGSALNAGQVGAMRAAEYIVNVCGCDVADAEVDSDQLAGLAGKIQSWRSEGQLVPSDTIRQIQQRMTQSAGHIRNLDRAKGALDEAINLLRRIDADGFQITKAGDVTAAIRAEHMALISAAIIHAVAELLSAGAGSRGSYVITDTTGEEIRPPVNDPFTGQVIRYRPENEALRGTILRERLDLQASQLFICEAVTPRCVTDEHEAFEVAWRRFRDGDVFHP
jgi:succinate dehydrogenase/fumarate reductase flavoprotein subunit